MNRKIRCFTPGTVLQHLDAVGKFEAIHELIQKAPIFKELSDPEGFERTVIQRERMQSTGFGKGVAFAHGSAKEVDSLFIALGISKKGIDFDSVDGKPVHLLFLIANNPQKRIEYLQALSALAHLVRDDDFREWLIREKHSDSLEKALSKRFSNRWAVRSA